MPVGLFEYAKEYIQAGNSILERTPVCRSWNPVFGCLGQGQLQSEQPH